MRPILILTMAAGMAASQAHAATLFATTPGDSGAFQCCSSGATVFSWTQADTWTDVQIDHLFYNNNSEGETRSGVAYLTTSIGPGTTNAAHEIDDAVVSTKTSGKQGLTIFSGLTLGPGTYYLVYHHPPADDFGDSLLLLFGDIDATEYGPGVTGVFWTYQDPAGVPGDYRPASEFYGPLVSSNYITITGNREAAPVPEPSGAVPFAFAMGIAVWRRARRS